MTKRSLPESFVLGSATSAYQIEGGWNEGRKGESIWDRFAHTPGAIMDGTTGDKACDHIHRWREDLALMAELGLDAYRFSVSWPRVLPEGTGYVNEAGLSFYDRLVDGLRERGIEPYLTLYHWDLPQALQDRGGWTARATVDAFCEYVAVVADRLGDRVRYWATVNEPACSSFTGHQQGEHAPGHRSEAEALAAVHHLLLAHGRGVPILRERVRDGRIGIVLNLFPVHPASESERDAAAARQLDAVLNRTFLDPISGRGYPDDAPYDRAVLDRHAENGDLKEIAAPVDFLGINYYSRQIAGGSSAGDAVRSAALRDEMTAMGWEVYPEGLYETVQRVHAEYDFPSLYITENGAAYDDRIVNGERIADPERISYLRRHLAQASRAAHDGIPLHGYFAWSLFDNFEWAFGLSKRFGLIYVDFGTGERIPKESYRWYKETIETRAIDGG